MFSSSREKLKRSLGIFEQPKMVNKSYNNNRVVERRRDSCKLSNYTVESFKRHNVYWKNFSKLSKREKKYNEYIKQIQKW